MGSGGEGGGGDLLSKQTGGEGSTPQPMIRVALR